MAKDSRTDFRKFVSQQGNPELAEKLEHTLALQTLNDNISEILKLVPYTGLLWMACNFLYNYGLMYSSITSSMVLNNSAPMWIWLFSLSPFIPVGERESF